MCEKMLSFFVEIARALSSMYMFGSAHAQKMLFCTFHFHMCPTLSLLCKAKKNCKGQTKLKLEIFLYYNFLVQITLLYFTVPPPYAPPPPPAASGAASREELRSWKGSLKKGRKV
jgi:hypothetical protein